MFTVTPSLREVSMSQIYPVNVKCKHKFREKSWTKKFPTSKSYLLIEKNLEKAAWSTLIICCDWFCIKDLLLQMSWSQRGLSTKPEIFKTSLPRRRCGRRPQVRLLVPAFPRACYHLEAFSVWLVTTTTTWRTKSASATFCSRHFKKKNRSYFRKSDWFWSHSNGWVCL